MKKTITQILQELVTNLSDVAREDVHLKLALPEKIFKEYCTIATPKERIILLGEAETDSSISIKKVYLNGGTVELIS